MIKYEDIACAHRQLRGSWGEDGEHVIEVCATVTPFNDKFSQFLTHCTACGGNWGGMLLTGIKDLWPSVYEAIPGYMGNAAWACLCNVLVLCGVDPHEEEE